MSRGTGPRERAYDALRVRSFQPTWSMCWCVRKRRRRPRRDPERVRARRAAARASRSASSPVPRGPSARAPVSTRHRLLAGPDDEAPRTAAATPTLRRAPDSARDTAPIVVRRDLGVQLGELAERPDGVLERPDLDRAGSTTHALAAPARRAPPATRSPGCAARRSARSRTSITSPGLRYSEAASGEKPATPDTVPVETTSPAEYPSAE